jgi:hypothetical protein
MLDASLERTFMNRALLAELQLQQAYPSITVLVNATPGSTLSASEESNALALVEQANRRLCDDATDELRKQLVGLLADMVQSLRSVRCGSAVALCVSPHYQATVHLGRGVNERVVIDDTFATRDLVADLNRTASYRVVTVSDRMCRLFVGDRQRLVEERSHIWPMTRSEDHSAATWSRDISTHLRAEHAAAPMATVVAGVERTVRSSVPPDLFEAIGYIAGNHDRSGWSDLHNAAWPLVSDWLRVGSQRALARLDEAKSMNLFAGGLDEVWSLANDGRVSVLLVEESYAVAARVTADGQLSPTHEREAPDVVDDVVDDTIEAVLRRGGSTVIVADGELASSDRIAAVLRY